MKKVILDTDIGDDIDDAFALMLLAKNPDVDLLGVTTVFRNAKARAKMAKSLLKELRRDDVNVYSGHDNPLVVNIDDLIPNEIKVKERVDSDGKYYLPQYIDYMDNEIIKDGAVEFIHEMVNKYPHEVIVALIGPMTNMAKLLQKYPSDAKLVKEIRIMGGGIDLGFAEWNVFCDPEAASIVYSSQIPIYSIGYNVTKYCGLSSDVISELKSIDLSSLKLVTRMMDMWFKHYEFTLPLMHDPLAVSTLFDDFVTFEPKKISIELKRFNKGYMYESEDGHLINYATKIDQPTKFLNYFLGQIKNNS